MTKDTIETDENAIELPMALNTQAAAGLYELILSLNATNIILDGSNVRRIGGLCLQILLAAQNSAISTGHRFVISPLSEEFAQHLVWLGVSASSFSGVQEQAL